MLLSVFFLYILPSVKGLCGTQDSGGQLVLGHSASVGKNFPSQS